MAILLRLLFNAGRENLASYLFLGRYFLSEINHHAGQQVQILNPFLKNSLPHTHADSGLCCLYALIL